MSLPSPITSGCCSARAVPDAQHVAEPDHLAVGVGHLDADRRLARDRGQDPDVVGGDRVGDVLGQRGDLLDLDRRAQLDLVAGDRRAAGEAGDLGVDRELVEHAGDRLDHGVVGAAAGAAAPARWAAGRSAAAGTGTSPSVAGCTVSRSCSPAAPSGTGSAGGVAGTAAGGARRTVPGRSTAAGSGRGRGGVLARPPGSRPRPGSPAGAGRGGAAGPARRSATGSGDPAAASPASGSAAVSASTPRPSSRRIRCGTCAHRGGGEHQ